MALLVDLWFFPLFFPVLVCWEIMGNHGKSWEILGNLQKSTNNVMSNSGQIMANSLSDRYEAVQCVQKVLSFFAPTENVLLRWLRAQFICIKTLWGMSSSTQLEMTFALVWGPSIYYVMTFSFFLGGGGAVGLEMGF